MHTEVVRRDGIAPPGFRVALDSLSRCRARVAVALLRRVRWLARCGLDHRRVHAHPGARSSRSPRPRRGHRRHQEPVSSVEALRDRWSCPRVRRRRRPPPRCGRRRRRCATGAWCVSTSRRAPARPRDLDRVLDGAVAEHVGPLRLRRRRTVRRGRTGRRRAASSRIASSLSSSASGTYASDAPSPRDAVAERAAALVLDVAGEHVEVPNVVRRRPRARRASTCRAARRARSGSAAATSRARASRPGRPARAARRTTSRVVAVGGREERQALHVVPVQVGEQDRAVERRAAEHRARASAARCPRRARASAARRRPRPRRTTCDRRRARTRARRPASTRARRRSATLTALASFLAPVALAQLAQARPGRSGRRRRPRRAPW